MNAPELPFFLLHPCRVTERTLLDPARLRARNTEALQADLNRMAGGDVLVALLPAEQRQAPNPMRYYRGCVIPIIATELMGEVDFDYVHEEVAHKFLKLPPDPKTGARRRRSTARGAMSHKAFGWYLEQVLVWATVDCGLVIPEPDRVGYRYEIPEAA